MCSESSLHPPSVPSGAESSEAGSTGRGDLSPVAKRRRGAGGHAARGRAFCLTYFGAPRSEAQEEDQSAASGGGEGLGGGLHRSDSGASQQGARLGGQRGGSDGAQAEDAEEQDDAGDAEAGSGGSGGEADAQRLSEQYRALALADAKVGGSLYAAFLDDSVDVEFLSFLLPSPPSFRPPTRRA